MAIFKKFSSSQKWRPFLTFEFWPKMAKHKVTSISLTVRDRAILSKFLTQRLSEKCTLGNFQKNFPSPKMAAILNFQIFAKNGKTQAKFLINGLEVWDGKPTISLTVRDRAISSMAFKVKRG